MLDPEQVAWIRHHHARWDGTGYPDGLAGAEPGDGAQILALADAWDVMTSARSYKSPLAVGDALEECRTQAGRQFAPGTVDALERLVEAGAIDAKAAAPDPATPPDYTGALSAPSNNSRLVIVRLEPVNWDPRYNQAVTIATVINGPIPVTP